MRTALTLLVAASMLPGTALGLSLIPDDREIVAIFVGEDFNGNIITRYIREGDADHSGGCGGFAPLDIDCSTGSHTLSFFTLHGLTFPACGSSKGAPALPAQVQVKSCYIGDAQSVLTGSTGERRFNCSAIYVPGPARAGTNPQIACSGSGTFPTRSATQNCHSRAYSTNDNSADGSGVGSGVGEWGCIILHF